MMLGLGLGLGLGLVVVMIGLGLVRLGEIRKAFIGSVCLLTCTIEEGRKERRKIRVRVMM